MPWHKSTDRYKPHTCRKPGTFRSRLHYLMDVWQCPKCQKRWQLLEYGSNSVIIWEQCDPTWRALDGWE